jgi:hypothetical protein
MKSFALIFAVMAIFLIASQLLCGLWLASKGATTEGTAFHRKLGVGATTAALLTAIMTVVLSIA